MIEVRKLTETGRQIAIISTEWMATPAEIAGPQFGRWYQENFFKYGRQHFDFDRLTDYKLETVCETTMVRNPAWTKLDGAVRKLASTLRGKKVKLCDYTLGTGLNGKEIKDLPEEERFLKLSHRTKRKEIDRRTAQSRHTERQPNCRKTLRDTQRNGGQIPRNRSRTILQNGIILKPVEVRCSELARQNLERGVLYEGWIEGNCFYK